MVLVCLLEVASNEVVVGADGNAEPRAVARVDDVLRLFWRKVFVVEVRGDMVRAVGVTAEDAELEAILSNAFSALNDVIMWSFPSFCLCDITLINFHSLNHLACQG